MSRNFKQGNAGVTILVIVVILIVAGILFFVNRGDQAVILDETATTTPEETTGALPQGASMEDGATPSEASVEATAAGAVDVQ
ncbi:MAG: hypothetical protein KBD16_03845 [Candidatus Pacebacteria bacterium]|nr:hypothetical protein [Candidatus Paceibacterota bacterium]